VEDLGSTNGTFVNGRRVERAALAPGDQVRLGRAELMVERTVPLPEATED
jgi:pSer/pThr/pTyr-binding forkhead associated (FHA) protein